MAGAVVLEHDEAAGGVDLGAAGPGGIGEAGLHRVQEAVRVGLRRARGGEDEGGGETGDGETGAHAPLLVMVGAAVYQTRRMQRSPCEARR